MKNKILDGLINAQVIYTKNGRVHKGYIKRIRIEVEPYVTFPDRRNFKLDRTLINFKNIIFKGGFED